MSIKTKLLGAGIASVLAVATPVAAHFEGLRLKAYLDPVGIPTVCYGTTLDIRLGMVFTKEECDALLKRDMAAAINTVDRLAPGLGVYQRAALASFVYNVGPAAFAGSTLLSKLRAGNVVGACNELTRWVYAGGVKLNGLVRRREAERKLCLRGLQ